MGIKQNWEKIKEALKSELGETLFEAWIKPLNFKEITDKEIILEVPDEFFKGWIREHYLELIKKIIKNNLQKELSVELVINPNLRNKDLEKKHKEFENRIREQSTTSILNPRYTFENFVVGPSNRFAHACSLAVAESPGKSYNPLFIYGGVGLGKTHLMQAICYRVKQIYKDTLKVLYIPSEKFTNELIEAIRHQTTSTFRQRYRNVDVLVIDDIHFIAGKESTQEEFFHTFNTLYDAHKQIIISSDRSPKEIPHLEERLVSRFGWGLITDIQPPDLETRIAILKKKIENEPIKMDDEVIYFIAQLIKTNIRELEGALIRVIAYAMLENKPITLDLTKEVLRDLIKEPQKLITIEQILNCVASFFGLSLVELKSKKRNKNIVFCRQLAMYLCRELTELSLPEIGEYLGGKDHTTVLHAYNKIKSELNLNPQLQNKIEEIIKIIKSY
ncbi:MAG: chromosomal replication initiator protein DnaA [Candidatus Omnitrophica bacterium]|nr:chromosomal replication initiator protein DnaA [Candidatus Omnitrophota bacterium]MCM8799146.1 chromosomal replication initiator protein DnaA [Candidatus Omnitrophota bacterium]